MPEALTLPLDDPAPVLALWAALDAAGVGGARPDYPPHVTLVIAERVPDPAALAGRLPVALAFAAVALFTRPATVLFAAPVSSIELLALQDAAAALSMGLHDHARPGAWMPHATLATGVKDAAHALSVIDFVPFRATASRIERVAFPPPRVLGSAPFSV